MEKGSVVQITLSFVLKPKPTENSDSRFTHQHQISIKKEGKKIEIMFASHKWDKDWSKTN